MDEGWPWTHRKPRRRKTTTFETYVENIKPLVREFADRPLRGGISRREARDWSNRWRECHLTATRAMFNDAIEDELCNDNPFSRLKQARSTGRKELLVLSNEEFAALVEIAELST